MPVTVQCTPQERVPWKIQAGPKRLVCSMVLPVRSSFVFQRLCLCALGSVSMSDTFMNSWDVAFDVDADRGARTLRSVFSAAGSPPGALRTLGWLPDKMSVKVWRPGESVAREQIVCCGAGASRVVYRSLVSPLAFKIADVDNYSDDNRSEHESPVPTWLVPRVHGYLPNKRLGNLQVSVLIMDQMERSLRDMGKKVPHEESMEAAQREYVEAVAGAWTLLARAAAETNCVLSDWNIGNLMVTKCDGLLDVRLIDWAGTYTSTQSSYQRVKKARITLLRDLSCFSDACSSGAAWFDALGLLANVCYKWWPPGFFPKWDGPGVPTVHDVHELREQLLSKIQGSPVSEESVPPAPAEVLPTDDVVMSIQGSPVSEASVPPAPVEVRPTDDVVLSSTPAASPRTSTPVACEPTLSERSVLTPCAQAILKALDVRRRPRAGIVSAAQLEDFMYDFPPQGNVEASMRATTIAAEYRPVAAQDHRLFQSSARPHFEGHVPLRERVMNGPLPRPPVYMPDLGDDLQLFVRLLLNLMPLDRIKLVWSTKDETWRMPKMRMPCDSTESILFSLHRPWALALNYGVGVRCSTISCVRKSPRANRMISSGKTSGCRKKKSVRL